MRRTRWVTLVLVALPLGACGASAPPIGVGPSAVGSPPVDREAVSPDPNFDAGFNIQITADGFHPRSLVAVCCHPVTWTNRTAATVTVAFDAQAVASGPIPPGGQFVFTPPSVQSISYHSGEAPPKRGLLYVNTPVER